jgi:hypothetical protein
MRNVTNSNEHVCYKIGAKKVMAEGIQLFIKWISESALKNRTTSIMIMNKNLVNGFT